MSPVPTAAELYEALLYALVAPANALRAGRFADGRAGALAALRAHGLELPDVPARTDAELATMAPAWLLVLGTSMEDGYSLVVVPEVDLDDEARASLARAGAATLDQASAVDDPALYRAYVHVHALAGLRSWADVELEGPSLPGDLAIDQATFAAWAERWGAGYVRLDGGAAAGTALDVRFTNLVHLFEWL